MASIATAIDNQDFMEYHSKALVIKANAKWIAAARLFYSVYYIQEAWHNQDYQMMLERYQTLVENVVELKRYSIKVQAELLSK
jgi:hypothetical protein